VLSREIEIANRRFDDPMEKALPTSYVCGAFHRMITLILRARALNAKTLIKPGNEQMRAVHVGKRSQFFASECGITRDSRIARGTGEENLGCAGK